MAPFSSSTASSRTSTVSPTLGGGDLVVALVLPLVELDDAFGLVADVDRRRRRRRCSRTRPVTILLASKTWVSSVSQAAMSWLKASSSCGLEFGVGQVELAEEVAVDHREGKVLRAAPRTAAGRRTTRWVRDYGPGQSTADDLCEDRKGGIIGTQPPPLQGGGKKRRSGPVEVLAVEKSVTMQTDPTEVPGSFLCYGGEAISSSSKSDGGAENVWPLITITADA